MVCVTLPGQTDAYVYYKNFHPFVRTDYTLDTPTTGLEEQSRASVLITLLQGVQCGRLNKAF